MSYDPQVACSPIDVLRCWATCPLCPSSLPRAKARASEKDRQQITSRRVLLQTNIHLHRLPARGEVDGTWFSSLWLGEVGSNHGKSFFCVAISEFHPCRGGAFFYYTADGTLGQYDSGELEPPGGRSARRLKGSSEGHEGCSMQHFTDNSRF